MQKNSTLNEFSSDHQEEGGGGGWGAGQNYSLKKCQCVLPTSRLQVTVTFN